MSKPRQASIRILHVRQPYVQFEIQPWAPALNVLETDDGFAVVAELAGINPADVQIDVHPTHVTIRGVRQLPLPQRLRRLHRIEIGVGPFQVVVPLEQPVEPDQVTAHYAAGLLEVNLPFARRTQQGAINIPIREGSSS
jgi:HSP20 family protein